MAFYKKKKQKVNGLWYPMAVTVGKPVNTDEVADRLAQISTVSRADTYAVLKDLAGVLADYMAQGRTVKMDGLGTFYYTANTIKNGVADEKDVSAAQIAGVRVRFIPEARRSGSGRNMVRSLISDNIFWVELPADAKTTDPGQGGGGDSEARTRSDPAPLAYPRRGLGRLAYPGHRREYLSG